MKEFLNDSTQNLEELAKRLAIEYQSSKPFPSIAIDNFFNEEKLNEVLAEFPDLSQLDSKAYENQREVKLAGKGEQFFGTHTKKLMHALNSEPFLNFLQLITGIEEPLIGDPYYIGGGQHEIKKDGFLKIHADFNKHPKMNLDRRINVLIYLNKDWKEEYGGHFELWDRNMEKCEKKILPVFNRLAMFSTTDFSYHGHPDPLNCPEGRSRKSLALYYYSNGRPQSEVNKGLEKHTTIFKQRKGFENDAKVNKHSISFRTKRLIKDFVPPILFKLLGRK